MTARAARLARICAPVALITLLAACNGGAEPPPPLTTPAGTTAATASASPSPTASPTVAAPTKPAAADAYTAEGMKAFVRYAIETFNYAYATGDTAPLKAISTKECDSCKASIRAVTTIWGQGGRAEGSQVSVIRMDTPGPIKGTRDSVAVDAKISAFVAYDRNGKVLEREKPGSRQYIFDLSRRGESWLLDGIRTGSR